MNRYDYLSNLYNSDIVFRRHVIYNYQFHLLIFYCNLEQYIAFYHHVFYIYSFHFVFFYYNYAGLREHGLGYLKHFLGPVWYLAWLFLPIELISHAFRPLTLGLRLWGNIMGDHLVLNVFSGMLPIGVPVVFMGLGFFVGFLQSFVFSLLTLIYLSLATSHDH